MSKQILFFIKSIYDAYHNEYGIRKIDVKFNKYAHHTVLTEDGKFISPKLKDLINTIQYEHSEHVINIKGVPVSVSIYKPLPYDANNDKINKIIQTIQFIAYLCKSINRNFHDEITIKIVLSPFKKMMSSIGEHLTAYNINSGFTMRDYHRGLSEIVIFREEEVNKVLIHELLHSFDIDSKLLNESYDMKFMKLFKKETRISLNECFTESFACLINVCLASIHYAVKRKISLNDAFVRLLDYERDYIVSVGERVGKHNFTNKREQTNITSYYVLKAITWMDIDSFARYIIANKYTIGRYRDYAQYLGKILDDNKNRIINMKLSDKRDVRTVNNMSIRMSSIDIFNI